MTGLNIDSYLNSNEIKGFSKNTKKNIKSVFNLLTSYYAGKNIYDVKQITPDSLNNFCKYVKENFKSRISIFSPLKYLFIWMCKYGLYQYDVKSVFSMRPKIIFNKYLNDYQKTIIKAGYTKRTLMRKLTILKNIQSFLSKQNIDNLCSLENDFVLNLADYFKEKKYSQKYIKSMMKESKHIFKYLLNKKMIDKTPFEKIRINEYSAEFKEYAQKYLKIKEHENTPYCTMRNIKNSLRLLFDYLAGNNIKRFAEIKREDLKSFIAYLMDLKNKDASPYYRITSINRNLDNLRSFFKWLESKNVCLGILRALKNLKCVTSLSRNILTRKELVNLFNVEVKSVYEFMFKTFFICQYATGLRINELLGLKLKDIDYENKTLLIYESKTRKERYVHIADAGLKYLEIYIKYAREKINMMSKDMENVFVSNYESQALREGVTNRYLKTFCKRIDIKKHISSHCFRHSYGTHLLENGAEIKHVSELLGHSKLETTEAYTRLSPESLKDIIKKYHPREAEGWN